MTRKIRLGAFLPGGGQHIAAWRHPDSPVDGATSFDFHVKLAQEAERGLFDAYFLADGLAIAFGAGVEGGNAKIAGILAGMQLIGLPADYVNTRNSRVEAVTAADVQRVSRRLLHADQIRFVLVGRPQGIAATN